jgi:hypothetical protein
MERRSIDRAGGGADQASARERLVGARAPGPEHRIEAAGTRSRIGIDTVCFPHLMPEMDGVRAPVAQVERRRDDVSEIEGDGLNTAAAT